MTQTKEYVVWKIWNVNKEQPIQFVNHSKYFAALRLTSTLFHNFDMISTYVIRCCPYSNFLLEEA